jgi:hypothetical protein
MHVTLRLTQTGHDALKRQLLPGDGREAVAVALCGRLRSRARHALTVQTVVPAPYDLCKIRTPDRVTWSTQRLIPLLEEASRRDLAILKIHSHPGGYPRFSSIDDNADADLFNSVFGWTDTALLPSVSGSTESPVWTRVHPARSVAVREAGASSQSELSGVD